MIVTDEDMEIKWWECFRHCCQSYRDIIARGMEAFDADGRYYGEQGAEFISGLWGMFVSAEMYDKCARLRDLADAYAKKYPQFERPHPIEIGYVPNLTN